MTRIRALLLFAAAALATFALAACGGDDGGDEDPKEVLEATLNNEQEVTSGVVDLSFDRSVEGEDEETSVELSGPFQDGENGAFSQFDMEADISYAGFSGPVGLLSTGDRAFLSFQGTDYEVPRGPFRRFVQRYAQLQSRNQTDEAARAEGTRQLVESFTDLSNEGTEDVEGTETVHVSGDLDIDKFAESVRDQAEEQSDAAGLPQGQLEQLNALLDRFGSIVREASLDVYSGAEDDILRKAELSVDVESPGGNSGTLDLSVTLSGVNEPQEIAGPPADAQPLSELLRLFGVDPNQLLQLLGAVVRGSSAVPPQTGGEAAAPTSEASQAYLECLQTADSSDALQECAALLER